MERMPLYGDAELKKEISKRTTKEIIFDLVKEVFIQQNKVETLERQVKELQYKAEVREEITFTPEEREALANLEATFITPKPIYKTTLTENKLQTKYNHK